MRRLLFLMICVLCVFVEGYAQGQLYNVYVKDPDGKPVRGVEVFTFLNHRMAEDAHKELKENYVLSQETLGNVLDRAKTDMAGMCQLKCSRAGTVLVDGEGAGIYDEWFLFRVEKYLKDGSIDLEFVLSTKSKGGGEEKFLFETKMDTAFVDVSLSMPALGHGIGRRHGGYVDVIKELDILGEHARDDARFVAFPYIVIEKTDSLHKDSTRNDTVFFSPVAVDGKNYSRSKVRRMGFDPSRDKLSDFHFDRSVQMQDHNSERFLYFKRIKISKGTKYRVPGELWYEDYNGVYHRENVLFHSGKEQEPMRFLDWSAALDVVTIDRELFRRTGALVTSKQSQPFKLDFEQGKARLNENDTITRAEKDRMLQWLESKKGELERIVVRGYSSPEGLQSTNVGLSRGRAETVRALLRSHFPEITVDTTFDQGSIYNIVPWETVADTMLMMDDSLAHHHSATLLQTIADKKGFDAQYRAIRANRELYDYLDEYVLHRVRVVRIDAHIIVRKHLSKEEIIDYYEKDVDDFRGNMQLDHNYVMMCHLADNKRWEELYKVAELAYNNYKEFQDENKYIKQPNDTVLRKLETYVPEPLAAYYYAVAALRTRRVKLDILKPYLDDMDVNTMDKNRKPYRAHKSNDGNPSVINGLPFIVCQIMMHCQNESFEEANRMIEKYNLMDAAGNARFPELKGLIMFVRCLAGHYNKPQDEPVRQYMLTKSTPLNRAVMLTALNRYRDALKTLYGNEMPRNDAKVEYLKAICHFNTQNSFITGLEVDGLRSSFVYNDEDDSGEETSTANPSAWAAPMLNALRLDNSNAKYLENDGYFNDAYRQMVLYFWKRMQMGVPMDRIAREYDALVAQLRKNKAQQKEN